MLSRSLNDIIFEGIYSYKRPKKARQLNAPRRHGVKPVGSYKYDKFLDIFKLVGPGEDMHVVDIYVEYMGREAPESNHKVKRELDRAFNAFNLAKRGFVILRGQAPHTKRMVVDDGSYEIKEYSTRGPKYLRDRKENALKRLQQKTIDKWSPTPDNPEDKLGFSHLDIQVLKFL